MDNSQNKKILIFQIIKALLFSVALMILFTATQVLFEVISVVLTMVYAFLRALGGDPYYSSRPIMSFATGQDAIMLASLLCTLATTVLFSSWWIGFASKYGQLGKRFKSGISYSLTHIPTLIMCTLIVYGFAELVVVGYALAAPEYVKQYEEIAESLIINNNYINILVVAILAPIGEECLFRGLILERLCRCMPALVAIVIQALLFGVLHGNLVQGSFVITLGLVNGYIVCRKKSIIPAIVIHGLQNGVSLILEALPDNIQNSNELNMAFFALPVVSIIILISIFPRDEYGHLDFRF